ncbi:MAG: ATP-grasp domain-containing protein [Lewinellaceae bacterium]|nr:ATP-grasp domain-containing protein [Lewinellaceae bacterium]
MHFSYTQPSDAEKHFSDLQNTLTDQFEHHFPDPMALKTVIILPSLSLDPEILLKIKGNIYYEERMLCLLMLLRMPRTHIIYLSSMPIHPEIVDYYLNLLPGITGQHARDRPTLISCYDASNRPLTAKILARRRLIEKIKRHIPHGHVAHLSGFNITSLEQNLALQLNVPVYGCAPSLSYWGTKSGSRKLFRKAGLNLPPGYEDLSSIAEVAVALQALHEQDPSIRKAMVKLNDGFSGDGNAIFSFEKVPAPTPENLRDGLKFVASDMTYDLFEKKFTQMGGIVEAFLTGEEKVSPSVQCRITPLNEVCVVSTHDQILAGEDEQIYTGASFPANPEYCREIGEMGYKLGVIMTEFGIMGRFGIDFISLKNNDGNWEHYAIEINLRKGGTTHPYLMLQFLTDGEYDYESGLYRMPNGQTRFYVATDGLQAAQYRCLTPPDLIDIAICYNLHFNSTIQEGVTFHLLGALSEFGKLGIVCIGKTPERAKEFYERTVEVLNLETSAESGALCEQSELD